MTALQVLLAVALIGGPSHAEVTAPPVKVEVDVSTLPDSEVTRDLARKIAEHQAQVLQDAGVDVTEHGSLILRVTVSRYGDGNVNYRATIAIVRDGNPKAIAERSMTCDLCRDGEFIIRIGDGVARMASFILYGQEEVPSREPVEERPDSTPPNGSQQTPENPEPERRPPPKRIGPMGFAGIASLATGTGLLAAGIPLALAPDRVRLAGDIVERRSTRPTGMALASVGSVLIAAGVVLTTLDVIRRKKQRRAAFVPYVAPTGVAVSMEVRF